MSSAGTTTPAAEAAAKADDQYDGPSRVRRSCQLLGDENDCDVMKEQGEEEEEKGDEPRTEDEGIGEAEVEAYVQRTLQHLSALTATSERLIDARCHRRAASDVLSSQVGGISSRNSSSVATTSQRPGQTARAQGGEGGSCEERSGDVKEGPFESAWHDWVEQVYFINLRRRTDRRVAFLAAMREQGVPPHKIVRVEGLHTPGNGALGCAAAHLSVMEHLWRAYSYCYCGSPRRGAAGKATTTGEEELTSADTTSSGVALSPPLPSPPSASRFVAPPQLAAGPAPHPPAAACSRVGPRSVGGVGGAGCGEGAATVGGTRDGGGPCSSLEDSGSLPLSPPLGTSNDVRDSVTRFVMVCEDDFVFTAPPAAVDAHLRRVFEAAAVGKGTQVVEETDGNDNHPSRRTTRGGEGGGNRSAATGETSEKVEGEGGGAVRPALLRRSPESCCSGSSSHPRIRTPSHHSDDPTVLRRLELDLLQLTASAYGFRRRPFSDPPSLTYRTHLCETATDYSKPSTQHRHPGDPPCSLEPPPISSPLSLPSSSSPSCDCCAGRPSGGTLGVRNYEDCAGLGIVRVVAAQTTSGYVLRCPPSLASTMQRRSEPAAAAAAVTVAGAGSLGSVGASRGERVAELLRDSFRRAVRGLLEAGDPSRFAADQAWKEVQRRDDVNW
eukprot:GHVU01068896.1.p1 GENE.GHVU01068896.1~~GHVU01068896.1.p1  ORF type:complete len:756 (-),score=128.83 GHVU01068896.1:1062-3062(-)